ncbi:MAG: glycogen synthase GlgA [bacterium]
MKIFYVSSEVAPFAKTGGLGDVTGALPKYLKQLGHDIRVMMPNYKLINERKYVLRDVIRLQGLELKIGNEIYQANGKSAFLPDSKVQVYFLDNKFFFDREGLYCDSKTGLDYQDNAERFIFFSKGCLETLKLLHWQPDIIHCNDWQTALIPLFLKSIYKEDPFFKNTKTLLTIHNLAYQGNFEPSVVQKAGLQDHISYSDSPVDYCGKFSFLKAGLEYADLLSTVSETYVNDIQESPDYGYGFEGFLKKRKNDLFGIINGIDIQVWNPETDKLIPFNYNKRTLSDKYKNKEELLKRFNLKFNENIPVISTISRLVDQKGFDLITAIIDQLMQLDLQLIILGIGEQKYHSFFRKIQKKYPTKFGIELSFNNPVAHLIEAGSDIYLMPSRFEPCGLNQLYSLKYGTIPIVRKTGGLADTIENIDINTISGTGFVFKKYDSNELLKIIKNALKLFNKKDIWVKIIQNAMKQDFSWKSSAQKYVKLYQKLMNTKTNKK